MIEAIIKCLILINFIVYFWRSANWMYLKFWKSFEYKVSEYGYNLNLELELNMKVKCSLNKILPIKITPWAWVCKGVVIRKLDYEKQTMKKDFNVVKKIEVDIFEDFQNFEIMLIIKHDIKIKLFKIRINADHFIFYFQWMCIKSCSSLVSTDRLFSQNWFMAQ